MCAKPLGDGPATFIGPTQVPKNRSDVVMPDIAAAWGISTLRRFTQQEMDELGQTALEQVLDMLKHGHLVGVDSRLPRILQRGGVHAAKYMADWRREGVEQITLSKDLLATVIVWLPPLVFCASHYRNTLCTRACARTIKPKSRQSVKIRT